MTPERYQQVKEMFLHAQPLNNCERSQFLDDSSQHDPALRADVESILSHCDRSSDFLETPAFSLEFARTAFLDDTPDDETVLVNRRLGPYQLVHQIASGGMGTVWLAERADDQFKKKVAVKLIKRGMDTNEILKRFRNERQVLANLEHPNIARLLDGGVSDDDRPYLVMEYIEGTPIDRYCDDRLLSISQRLHLFQIVCAAVQFAHQNLVVHRDLKPGNIVVSADGLPKLLDFGIAKMLGPDGAGMSAVATVEGSSFFTADFASPEQISDEPMSTSSDVYSLGVVLYELLTGHRPYRVTPRDRGEIARLVREAEPPRPSTIIQRTVDTPDHEGRPTARITPHSVSAARQTEADRLRRQLAGDLDTIVLQAMQKDARRRYASVEQLSEDIRRHLEGLPVGARPDTWRYRGAKFVRRNRFAVAAGAAMLVSLFAGLSVSTVLFLRADEARKDAQKHAAKAGAVNLFLQDLLGAANPMTAKSPDLTVKETLDRAAQEIESGALADHPEVEAEARLTVGNTYRFLGEYAAAEPQLQKALDIRKALFGPNHASVAECLRHLAKLLQARSDLDGAEPLHREALGIMRKVLDAPNPELAQALNDLAKFMQLKGDSAESDRLFREALTMRKRLPGDAAIEVAETLNDWAILKDAEGDAAGATSLMRESLIIFRQKFGNEHPTTATSLHNLAELIKFQGDYAGAVLLHREALAIRRRLLGEEHPHVALSKRGLGDVLRMMDDDTAAEPLLLEALGTQRKVLGQQHYEVGTTLANLSSLLKERGDHAAAESVAREALEVYRNAFGPDHAYSAAVLYRVAELRVVQQDLTEGERLHRKALAVRRAKLPPDHADIALSLVALGSVLVDMDRLEQAEAFLHEAMTIVSNPARKADSCVGWAKSGLGALLTAQHRFHESEPLLVTGYELLRRDSSMSLRLREERVRTALQRIVILYEEWGQVARKPSNSEKAAEWRNTLQTSIGHSPQ